MKKILTVLTAVLLLCATVFTMASCGSVDMADLKSELQTKYGENSDYDLELLEGEEQTGSKYVLKKYTITQVVWLNKELGRKYERELTIIEYSDKDLAKLDIKEFKLAQKYADKAGYFDYEEDLTELEIKRQEIINGIEGTTIKVEPFEEEICKRKGNIVITGNKELYKEIF